MNGLHPLRRHIRALHLAEEGDVLRRVIDSAAISDADRQAFSAKAVEMIKSIRSDDQLGLMEVFLAEYGLSTSEGVALMCLAEALLRVPDAETIDDLIEDKIAPSSWGQHLGKSSSSLVNASTWALMLTGKVLDTEKSSGVTNVLHGAIKRLGEPVIRVAVKRAMKEMGNQFVLGETIQDAVRRGSAKHKQGFTYSYDMLGEAALTANDADRFYAAYKNSIEVLSTKSNDDDIRANPGISIKLSALHPRYEVGQKERVLDELVPRILSLALIAKDANMGLNIDAEEMDRLDLSLDLIEQSLRDERLKGWDGFGVVVQAYSKRSSAIIDWLYALSETLDRKIMVRLVKGAYWDTEIKRAQVEGLDDFPVFTHKSGTDVSYICCAKKLLGMTDRIYPQFATHNAHSVAAILNLAKDKRAFEFQALHGMGEVMHRQVLEGEGTRCRVYAPVGEHRNLLAYLVRRLLENGANSSFVNQIVDEAVAPEIIAADPFDAINMGHITTNKNIRKPQDLFAPKRLNSTGWDLHDVKDLVEIEAAREPFKTKQWSAVPLIMGKASSKEKISVANPANENDIVGTVIEATESDVETALSKAKPWNTATPIERRDILNRAADLYEENYGLLFAVLTREAGKTPRDAIAELREAVDFLRYYAVEIERLSTEENNGVERGLVTCISPWNFPLAIFTGQIAAALAAGNGVLAKPAETTPIIAFLSVKMLHEAGVPKACLQLLPGEGRVIGAKLTSDPRVKGVCFTGSTATAQHINRAMAETIEPDAPLIAETGGLNAMIVDSSALPEQAVQDIVTSSFQSAGQRCSALRLLYLQEDIAEEFMNMLFGAMDEQTLGNPWDYTTDIGPIITQDAKKAILEHIDIARKDGRLLKYITPPTQGSFVGPAVISVSKLSDLGTEVFGPVLHVATFKSDEINRIVKDINASGYGLTFGLHTRIDQRVEDITQSITVGNMYINRNQIGAVVGSQPFGGEGLSGTGPKAGGPHYVRRFTKPITEQDLQSNEFDLNGEVITFDAVQSAIFDRPPAQIKSLSTVEMSGPTGESNRLSTYARGLILCLGPSHEAAQAQAQIAKESGCSTLIISVGAKGENAINGTINIQELQSLEGFDAVAYWGDATISRKIRIALAKRNGALLPLLCESDMAERCVLERHICVDTTASGGNVSLLAKA